MNHETSPYPIVNTYYNLKQLSDRGPVDGKHSRYSHFVLMLKVRCCSFRCVTEWNMKLLDDNFFSTSSNGSFAAEEKTKSTDDNVYTALCIDLIPASQENLSSWAPVTAPFKLFEGNGSWAHNLGKRRQKQVSLSKNFIIFSETLKKGIDFVLVHSAIPPNHFAVGQSTEYRFGLL